MLDFQKAFGTVNHDILCNKLKTMGVESVEWFSAYLTERTKCISVNNILSQHQGRTCGVPLGSILGPLLFFCFIHDMRTSISEKFKHIVYADDSADRNPNNISNVLGKELKNNSKWLVYNKLSLHLGKTECILFGSKRKLFTATMQWSHY